jgi:geranylgeranyl pyrophosphate synthase
VHVAFDEAIAILAGDGLLTAAFGALADLGAGAGDAVRVLAQRAGAFELLGGQAIDLAMAAAGREAGTLEEVERLHAGKTGALFAASTELGGIAAGALPAARATLARYGMAIGVAFQHADDRDDQEFQALAAQAAARMRALCDEAAELARGFGERGRVLEAVAAWIGAKS